MFSLAQLAEIGDFDERLVIDSVDSQACLRLGERGIQHRVPGSADGAPDR